MRIRLSVLIAVLAVAGLTGIAAPSAPSEPPPTVTCDKIIGMVGHAGSYRVVLGAVAVPQGYHRQIIATRKSPWPYWRKAGLMVRAGSQPVSVLVPTAWRNRAAITWGNSGIVSSLRIASCPQSGRERWNAYAGGFRLRARSACVPLIFRVGRRSATVRFGLGRVCP